MPRWGIGSNVQPRSADSILIVEPTLGIDSSQPSVDAPLGSTPALGGMELVSTVDGRYPVVSSTTRWAAYGLSGSPNGWSVLSYVSSGGLSDPPNLAATDYYDFAQIYYPLRDENLAIAGASSYQSLYCTQSNTTLFSTL